MVLSAYVHVIRRYSYIRRVSNIYAYVFSAAGFTVKTIFFRFSLWGGGRKKRSGYYTESYRLIARVKR